ncbi:hypothetical protein Tco_1370112 [Tanacetum coccineum]
MTDWIYVRGVPLILASKIMPPRMTTRSAGRSTAAPRGGRTGRRTGRGSGRTRELRVKVDTCWIQKIESVHDMSGCGDDQKVKYTAGSFVGKALMWWNS